MKIQRASQLFVMALFLAVAAGFAPSAWLQAPSTGSGQAYPAKAVKDSGARID